MENSIMYIILVNNNKLFKKHFLESKFEQWNAREVKKPYTIHQVDMTYLEDTIPTEEDLIKIISHIRHTKSLDKHAQIFFVGHDYHYDELFKMLEKEFNGDSAIQFFVN